MYGFKRAAAVTTLLPHNLESIDFVQHSLGCRVAMADKEVCTLSTSLAYFSSCVIVVLVHPGGHRDPEKTSWGETRAERRFPFFFS